MLTHASLRNFATQFESQILDTDDVSNFIQASNTATKLLNSNLQRAKELVDNFKRTAADQSHNEIESINFLEYYKKIASTLYPILKLKRVDLSIEGNDSIIIKTFPGAHAQIITNLISNSVIHGFNDLTSNKIRLSLESIDNEVIVRYFDNGKGVDEKIKNKIFEPFFTTARSTGNTGLGLSIVYNIVVKQFGGRVSLVSVENGFGLEYTIKESA